VFYALEKHTGKNTPKRGNRRLSAAYFRRTGASRRWNNIDNTESNRDRFALFIRGFMAILRAFSSIFDIYLQIFIVVQLINLIS